jgi:hypothetical protein
MFPKKHTFSSFFVGSLNDLALTIHHK